MSHKPGYLVKKLFDTRATTLVLTSGKETKTLQVLVQTLDSHSSYPLLVTLRVSPLWRLL